MSIAPSPSLLSFPSIEEHLNLFPCTQVGIQGIRFIEQAQPIKPFKKKSNNLDGSFWLPDIDV